MIDKIIMEENRKGAMEAVSVILVYMVTLLLIVAVAPFISKTEFTADLQGNQIASKKKYVAHATMASIKSNSDVMDEMNMYPVNQPDSAPSQVENLLQAQASSYNFRVEERENNEWVEIAGVESSDSESRRYSEIMIASPKENQARIVVGTGGLN